MHPRPKTKWERFYERHDKVVDTSLMIAFYSLITWFIIFFGA